MITRVLYPVLGALILLAGCDRAVREAEAPVASTPAATVTTVAASIEQWPLTYEATGTVRARSSTVIAAKWMGYVREVKVQLGDRVNAGQMLAVLDARDLDAAANRAAAARAELKNAIPEVESALAAAQAHLDLAESTHRRMRELYEKRSISDHEFDEAVAKLKAAQADFAMARARRTQLDDKIAQSDQEVQTAQVNRGYAEIASPAAGVITVKSIEPGTLAAPGAPLFTIESGGYRLEVSIEESRTASIRQGASAVINLDGIDRAIEARVSEIVPSVDAASRSYIAKLDLPAIAGLRSGLFGRATFTTGGRSVLSIPESALIERGQLQSVFVADEGVAHTRLITAGSRDHGRVEVLSGLVSGDAVIVAIPQNLADGAKVEVRP